MAFVTNAQVKTSVAGALHKVVADLAAYWDDLISDANTAAYDQICHRFLLLGYTQAQIDAWDRGPTFNKFIARYQALIDGAGDQDNVGEWRTELDYWRGQLDEVTTLDDGGATVEPDAGAGSVGHGSLSTARDRFVLDANDSRIGNPTEW